MLRGGGAGYSWYSYLDTSPHNTTPAKQRLLFRPDQSSELVLQTINRRSCTITEKAPAHSWRMLCVSALCVQSWHMMTFSLEFSWITWIPLPLSPSSSQSSVTSPGFRSWSNEAFCQSAQPAQLTANCLHRIPAPASFLWHWLGLVVDIYREVKAKNDCSVDISTYYLLSSNYRWLCRSRVPTSPLAAAEDSLIRPQFSSNIIR